MIIYPDYYCKNVFQIDEKFLKMHNIKGIILDVDNTLVDKSRIISKEMIEWHNNIKQSEIKTIILSNSIRKNKIEKISNELGIDYINFAKKPLNFGYKKVIKKMDLNVEEIAAIGDQIFPDVVGAKCMKLYTILVEPLSVDEPFRVKWKRPIEKFILKKYLKKRKKL